MSIYIAAYLALMLLCVADKNSHKKIKNLGLIFSFLLVLLLVGTRDETGTDWLPYWDHYISSNRNNFDIFNFEPGYQLFVDISKYFGLTYSQFLFFFTFTYLAIFYSAFSYFKYPNTIVFLFYSTYLIGLMGTSRQLIAISICCLAITKLLQRRNYLFLVLILMASLFHRSSIIFLIALMLFPFSDFKKNNVALYSVAAALIVMITVVDLNWLISLISPLQFIVSKLQDYMITDTQSSIYYVEDQWLVLLLYTKRAVLALFFIIESRKNHYPIQYKFIAVLYATGFAIFCAAYPLMPAVAVRLSLYFSFFDIIFLSYFAWNSQWKNWGLIAVLLLSAQGMRSSLSYDSDLIIPYKGLLFNSDLYRQLR